MSRILIAGASGLIYRELVRQLPAEHQLTLLCRKPGQPQPARHWLPVNFDMLAEVNLPEPVDLAFCCLGTTRKEAGSVRRPSPGRSRLCAGLCRAGPPPRLPATGGGLEPGANPHSPALYPRTKGRWSRHCWQSWLRLAIVRPAMLLGDRQPPRRSEQFFQAIYPLLKPLLVGRLRRWRAIEAGQVARAMITLSRQPAGCEVVENERLLQL